MRAPRTAPLCRRHATFLDRRRFLILGGSSVAVVGAVGRGGPAGAQQAALVRSSYPELRIAAFSELLPKTPVEFTYPNEDVVNLLVMLQEPAGGGIGPNRDVVAFNTVCTHMGGPVGPESYKPEHNILGPCPLHLTTFDLSRHGMMVSGHATESLPQIVLELRGDDIFAIGIMGLMYGYTENPTEA